MVFGRRSDPFEHFEREFEQMSQMMDEMMESMRGLDWAHRRPGEPVYYGVSVDIGPDGIPHVQRFGNVRPQQQAIGPGDTEVREPFATAIMDEEKGEIQVTAELPGIDEEKIKIKTHGDELDLRAVGNDRTYEKKMQLPARVDPKDIRKTYRNGVLHITLKREG